MKRQLIAGICALLIMPGIFIYQPSDSAEASQSDATNEMQMVRQEESEAEHKDVPWVPILILAFIVPTAALVIPAFFLGKKTEESTGPSG